MTSSDDAPVILAIDSGTSSCKVVAIDAGGSVVGEASSPHALQQPRPGWAEQEASGWWDAAVLATRELAPDVRRRVICVTVTSQREGMVAVDESGEPLAPCLIWLDRRAESELPSIAARVSEDDLFDVTGLRLDAAFSLPRILWLQTNAPDLLERAAYLLQPADFLLAQLTGRFVTDVSFASRTALLDVRRRTWADSLLSLFSIEPRLLPELVEPGELVGPVSATAATQLTIPPTAVVTAGAGDQQAGAVGAGAHRSGSIAVSLGTSTSVVALTAGPVLDPRRRILCNCSALPGGWDLQAPIWTTGAAIEWLGNLTGAGNEHVVSSALSLEPGVDGLVALPHFAGAGAPHWQSNTAGALIGLRLGHGAPHIARAILEAIGYEIRANIDVISELTEPTEQVTLTGGLGRHTRLVELYASLLGLPVEVVDVSSTSALGVYATAAVQTALAPDITAALSKVREHSQLVEPDPNLRERYQLLLAGRAELIERQIAALPAKSRSG